MTKCSNCGATLTCGCQKRMLPNGKSGCTRCASQPAGEKINTAAKPK